MSAAKGPAAILGGPPGDPEVCWPGEAWRLPTAPIGFATAAPAPGKAPCGAPARPLCAALLRNRRKRGERPGSALGSTFAERPFVVPICPRAHVDPHTPLVRSNVTRTQQQ